MHNPSYYEAKLQLRTLDEDVTNFVRKKIIEKNINIAKEVKLKNGVDLYLSSQRFARSLGQLLKRVFNGELKTSRSLFTKNKQTGKNVYRVTVCFRT